MSARGLPVFSTSAATNSSARDSMASAKRSSASSARGRARRPPWPRRARTVRVVERPEEDVLVVGLAGLRGLGLLGQRVDDVGVDLGRGDHARRRRAVLAGVEVAADGDRLGRERDVGVVEDDHRRLAAELEVHALEVGRGGAGHLHACAHGARDRDELRRRMRHERAARVAIAADHVEHAWREELGRNLGHQQRRDGSRVAGLEHDAVACSECRADLPGRHQQRVVPGRHLADDADRLAADERGHAAHVLAGGAPLEDTRRACEEAQLVDHRGDLLRGRERARLAGVLDLGVDELVRAGLDRVGEAEQRELALGRRGVAPFHEGGGRRGVGAVDVLLVGDGCLGVDLAGGGVDHVRVASGMGLDVLAVDEVLERAGRGGGHRSLLL